MIVTPRILEPLAPFPLIDADMRSLDDGGFELRVGADQAHGYDVEFHRVIVKLSARELSMLATYGDLERRLRPLIEKAHDEILDRCLERWRVIAEPLGLKTLKEAA